MKKGFLRLFFNSQIDGYKQANNVDSNNREKVFGNPEKQFLGKNYPDDCHDHSLILHRTLGHSMLELKLDGEMNVPIYIVNDTRSLGAFIQLAKLIFPGVDASQFIKDIDVPHDFKIEYHESSTSMKISKIFM